MLFNNTNEGGKELKELLGFIDASTNFTKWITWLELSKRQTISILGTALYKRADDFYKTDAYLTDTSSIDEPTEEEQTVILNQQLVHKFQLPIALFAYVKMIPSIDAGHSNGGRMKAVGENERSLTAVEAYKDEANILNLAYEALEDLINFCEENKLEEWTNSELKKTSGTLLIKNASTFNLYYRINSSRLYYTLIPMIKEVQDRYVIPIMTKSRFETLVTALAKTTDFTEEETKLKDLLSTICRSLALQTMVLALQRLPLEVLPEGIVQTQIVGTVKEKLVASEKARNTMIESLSADAETNFNSLQEEIALLINPDTTLRTVAAPHIIDEMHGFSF